MEVIDSIDSLIKKVKSLDDGLIENLIQIINNFDIYFNYEKNKNNSVIRIILRIKKNSNIHPLIYYYSNGCVIDTIKWKILAQPPMTFNKRNVPDIIENFYKNNLYDIMKVIDGTVITLYYWNNRWNISTSNSYDVSSFYWMGPLTYVEVIYDLLSRLYPDAIEKNGIEFIDNCNLDFANLDKNKSYTIGIRHHDFHPLLLDPERMWNIQNVDLTNGKVEYNDGLIGIPNQQVISAVDSIDQLNYLNKMSIPDAIRSENPVFNYGYILRSKKPEVTKEYSNILLSSNLLKKIKKNIYEYPSNTLKQFILHTNRFEFIAIKNYFNKIERNEMLHLYPQFKEKYLVYSKCMNEKIACSLLIMKNKQTNNNDPLNFQTCIITLAYALYKNISKFEALDPFHPDTESILKDYYSNVEYSVLFLNAINKYKYK